MRALVVLLAAALLLPAAALAQAPDYGPVEVIPNPQSGVIGLAAAWTTNPAGTFALTWSAQGRNSDGYVFGARSPLAVGTPPATLLGPARQKSGFGSLPPAIGFRTSGSVVVASRSSAPARLGATAGATTNRLPAPRTLAFPGGSVNGAVLGMRSDGGTVIAVSICSARCTRRTISLVTRSNTGWLGAPVALTGSGAARTVAIAVNARGDAFTVWVRGKQVQGRLRTGGGSVGPVVNFGPAQYSFAPLAVTITPRRRVVVAWENQTVHEGSTVSSDATFSVAVSQDGRSFTHATMLETQTDRIRTPGRAIVATLASDDTTWLAWSIRSSGHFVVRAARVTSTGPQGATTLSTATTADAAISSIAGGPDHRVAAVWSETPTGSEAEDAAVVAAVRPHGSWDAPETVAAGTRVFPDEQFPVVTIDETSGIALFAWTQSTGGAGTSGEQVALRTRAIP